MPIEVSCEELPHCGPITTRDISVGGVFLFTASEVALGTVLHMRFVCDGARLKATGEVVHRLPGIGVGVAFRVVDARWAGQVESFILAAEAQAA